MVVVVGGYLLLIQHIDSHILDDSDVDGGGDQVL